MLLRIASLTTLLAVVLLAQDFRSTLQGTITDPSQASVAGATVTLKNIDTAAERVTNADNDGFYIFQFLAPGNYQLSVKASGFRTAVQKGLTLALTQTLCEDVKLLLHSLPH